MDARRGGSEIASCELARSKLRSSPHQTPRPLDVWTASGASRTGAIDTSENRLDIHTLPSPPTSSSRHHQRQPETCQHLCLPLFARPPSAPHQTTPFSDHHNINTLINSITACDRCQPARFLPTRSPPVSSDPRRPSVSIRIDDGIPRSARFESRNGSAATVPPVCRAGASGRAAASGPSQVAMSRSRTSVESVFRNVFIFSCSPAPTRTLHSGLDTSPPWCTEASRRRCSRATADITCVFASVFHGLPRLLDLSCLSPCHVLPACLPRDHDVSW